MIFNINTLIGIKELPDKTLARNCNIYHMIKQELTNKMPIFSQCYGIYNKTVLTTNRLNLINMYLYI